MATALADAKKRGQPVHVSAATSETSDTIAYPDGHLMTTVNSGPVRVKQADGTWSAIDTTLVESHGALRPKVSKADVQLSTGGNAPFAQLAYDGGKTFALRWPSTLSTPTVRGNTAVYRGAAGPTGDLVVTALPTGLRFDIVLRERPGAPVEIKVPFTLNGLNMEAAADGRLSLSGGEKKPVALSTKPEMWESGPSGETAGIHSRHGDKGRHGKITARIATGDGGKALILKPDASFLNDPATRYPVTVDPSVLLPLNDDTDVNSVFDWNNVDGPYLSVGSRERDELSRAYLRFNTAGLPSSITSAELALQNVDAPSCGTSVGTGVQVRRVTSAWDATTLTWSPQPTNTTEDAVISKEGSQEGFCGSGFMRWNVTGIVQDWQAGSPNHGVVLQDPAEPKTGNYRVFTSSEGAGESGTPPTLTVTYKLPPAIPEVTLSSADSVTGNDVVSRSGQVKVAYSSTTSGGENVDYFVTVSDASGPIGNPPPLTNVPSGQVTEYTFAMGNPDTFKVSFKACVSGSTVLCSQTPAYRITSDAPHAPTDLATGLTEPTNPILSGIVSRPSGELVTGRFYLYDAQGAPVGATPFGEGSVKGGTRVSLRVPDGVLSANASYSWQMEACVEEVCSAKTPAIRFSTSGSAPQEPVGTDTVVLDKSKLTIRTAKTAADACDGGPCALVDAAAVQVGGAGADRRISLVKADLARVPAGAQITSAILKLGSADCGGPCPAGAKISVYAKKTELSDSPDGAELAGDLVAAPEQQADLSAAQVDVTGTVRQWRQETTGDYFVDPGLVLLADETLPPTTLGDASGQVPISLTIEYLPPTAPGKITDIRSRAGDAGVLLAWGKPETLGADAPVDSYDIQVLNADGNVLRTLSSEVDRAIVDGLTNGMSYRFQVRARTAYGSGPWQTSAPVTPQAVANATSFVEAVEQFVDATQGMRDKRYENTGDATDGDSQAVAIAPILYTNENNLLTDGAPNRDTSQIGLSHTLVSAAADGSIIVRTGITGKTTYGTDGAPLVNGWEEQSDFVFTTGSSGLRLTRQNSSGAVDAPVDIDEVEINAWAGGVPDDPAPALTALQADNDLRANVTAAVSPSAAAAWAVANVGAPTRAGWEYPNDCANFVSKALARGGRYRQIHAASWFGWLDQRHNGSWWESHEWGKDSWTFSAAQKNYNHFAGQHRVTVRKTIAEAQVGDIIWFINRKTDQISHMGIVTYRYSTVRGKWDIFFAQHGGHGGTGSGPYMNLGDRYDATEFKGLIFAKVNW
ncbi:DNRLRE domain-containing protein [Microbispora sp. NBRC 16548]|uniref:DNRLRE domain-containing protein n=1 Tax=Microbispora sp. NBRC 16548 TaxID=3030994 RepID=UPI0024A050BE|nr:DNRLRE domain-containing protein [Microbispora sp. NBRC 16548]GLX03808.1 hypothetical protein Misp03_07350 [Microbispora sp. NBRC 16548]